MRKEDKIICNLVEGIESIHTISCIKCAKENTVSHCDEYEAAESFFNQGWYATENNVYCPQCNEKRNKKKKYENSNL